MKNNIYSLLMSALYVGITFMYILCLGLNFDHDHRYNRWYDLMDFSVLYPTFVLFSLHILTISFTQRYKSILPSHVFIIFLYYALIANVLNGGAYNETTLYYYFFYIMLFGIHLIVFCSSVYYFFKNRNN